MKTEINLRLVAETHEVDAATVIDPVRLAVALHLQRGVGVTEAARLCDVGRSALQTKITNIKLS